MKRYFILFILILFSLQIAGCAGTIEKYDPFDGDASPDSAVYSGGIQNTAPMGLEAGAPIAEPPRY